MAAGYQSCAISSRGRGVGAQRSGRPGSTRWRVVVPTGCGPVGAGRASGIAAVVVAVGAVVVPAVVVACAVAGSAAVVASAPVLSRPASSAAAGRERRRGAVRDMGGFLRTDRVLGVVP